MANEEVTLKGFIGLSPPFVKSPDHKNIYVNSCRAGIGPYDIRLIFGHMIEQVPNQQVCEDLATIIMSPEEAKVVGNMLLAAIKNYETMFGEIKDVVAILEKAKLDAGTAVIPTQN